MRILIIEDTEASAAALRRILEHYDLVECSSIDEALKHLRKQYFDVIVSDVYVIGGSIVNAYDDLRALHGKRPMIAISGVDAAEAKARGFNVALQKPFDASELLDHIRRLTAS